MALLTYIKETHNEMTHVQWPTTKKTLTFTLIVLLFTVIMAYVLGAVDFGFIHGLGLLRQLLS